MSLVVAQHGLSSQSPVTKSLDPSWFGVEPNVALLHQVVTAQLAAARAGTQSTRTRAEVSGGGKKPFKQKGTGRARQGSERAPHFSGGGVALGPKPRSYRQRTPRKMINLALRAALSDRAAKAAASALASLGVAGRVLVVLGRDDETAYKSFRNLPSVQVILSGELNAYDVLCNDWVIFTERTLPGEAHVVESDPRGAGAPEAREDNAGPDEEEAPDHE